MSDAGTPRIVHSLPGRVRVHLPGVSGARAAEIAGQLERVPGVVRARASGLTNNVLIVFDAGRLDARTIVERLRPLVAQSPVDARVTAPASRPGRSVLEAHWSARRARVAVHGLDRDPDLGGRLVDRLSQRPEVRRVSPSTLTGRVVIELEEGTETIRGILEDIAELELPAEDEHEFPAHPLDPGPIIEGGAKTIGAALGLLLLGVRQVAGAEGAPVPISGPGEVAGTVALVQGTAPVANRIEDRLGHKRKELLLGATAMIAMAASGSALGLAFAGAAGLRLLTESAARRRAWQEYERRIAEDPAVYPGAVLTLSRGQRAPLAAKVLEGSGVFAALDGSSRPLFPRAAMDSGARVYGGTVTVELGAAERFEPAAAPGPARVTVFERYMRLVPYSALLYAAATGIATRSPVRMLTALLLVSPMPALAGRESADRGACARVIRAGVTVVGSRPERAITCPDILVIDEPRTVCDGWEFSRALAVADGFDEHGMLALAAVVSNSAGSPWGLALPVRGSQKATDGRFDGRVASAEIGGERWLLETGSGEEVGAERCEPDEQAVVLRRQRDGLVAGALALRPRLARGLDQLVQACDSASVRLELAARSRTRSVRRIARRAGVALVMGPAENRVRHLRDEGWVVAVVSDSASAGAAFERCDLAIGLSSGRSGSFAARADLLAPRLEAVSAIVDAGARRDIAVRDAVLVSAAANVGGATWGALRSPPFRLGTRPTHVGGLVAIVDGAARLWGGQRARTVAERLSDPQPERWGRVSVEAVLRELQTTPDGLTGTEARERWRPRPDAQAPRGLMSLMFKQVKSPVVGVLGAGAALSIAMGVIGDVVMIGAVVAANGLVGAWQEGRAGAATRALHELSAGSARVIRDRAPTIVPQADLVPGDVILLASGDRVPADARMISAEALEIDEAALTGESIPVLKSAEDRSERERIVLEGTDVVTGTGRAVVLAVGEDTRMGAIAAALAESPDARSPLDKRLGEMLVHALPWVAASGLMVTAAGVIWGRPAMAQLALGMSVAVAVVPEGLPLITGAAEAAVAQRLAKRQALVTRLSAVEALGRADVACVDKTGTLTTGTLALTLVAGAVDGQAPPGALTPALRHVLRAAAIASPSPDALDAHSHPTDVAVLEGARAAGLPDARTEREAESPFDPTRGFHATLASGRLWLKGAVEVLAERCAYVRVQGRDESVGTERRSQLLDRAAALAGQGLRILLVAEGPTHTSVEDPRGLTALGFIGISDPLRPRAAAAVARCREAGVRVVMLTGDHPVTAQAIARQAGLPAEDERMLTGEEVEGLGEEALAQRLERATIIARTMPLQKLRIVETLRERGHVVAMTGDGVNDAPALRLADVGVAMGRGGTEVARQAADLVLIDDDFETLAEALVEGRAFWHNMRRALGLLLGGNAGEVGLIAASVLTGLASPLTTRQVLTINLVTDVLPAVSVAIQPPEHRHLARLAREGGAALDAPLRADIIRRAVATAAPSFAAYLLASRVSSPAAGRSVAYLCIVATQLAQTVDLGQSEGRLTVPVLAAVGGSLAVVGTTLAVPRLRDFLSLAPVTASGVLIAGGASWLAVVLGRVTPVELWLSRPVITHGHDAPQLVA